METRRIGSLEVSAVGLGCNNFGWRIDAAASAEVVNAALESGITFFDTADRYGIGQSEEFLGRALASRRSDVRIATKFGAEMSDEKQGAAPAYVREAVEASLRRLQIDRIDLYQLHRPDLKTPIVDTMGVLRDLVQAGKVREIGCSNFTVAQMREAAAAAKNGVRFVSVQNEYSMLHRAPERDGVLAECEATGVAFLPYFPLANGLLTGKYRAGRLPAPGTRAAEKFGPDVFTPENFAIVEKLGEFARSRDHTILELAFAWLLAREEIASVIAGASKPEQVRANAEAADWRLTPGDLAGIETILRAPTR